MRAACQAAHPTPASKRSLRCRVAPTMQLNLWHRTCRQRGRPAQCIGSLSRRLHHHPRRIAHLNMMPPLACYREASPVACLSCRSPPSATISFVPSAAAVLRLLAAAEPGRLKHVQHVLDGIQAQMRTERALPKQECVRVLLLGGSGHWRECGSAGTVDGPPPAPRRRSQSRSYTQGRAELFLCDLNKITRRTPRIASRRSTQLLPLSRHTLRRNAKRGSPLRRASLDRAAGLVRSAVPPGNWAPRPRSWVTGGHLDRTRERAKTRLLLLEAREGTLLAGRQESRDGGLGSHLEQMPDQRHPRTHGGARGGAHH